MNYGTLRKIAEKIEIALLEKQATKEISQYHIEVIPDDLKIEAWVVKNPGISKIQVQVAVNRTP